MAFQDYSQTPDDNTELGDGTYIGPNMLRNKVRPALQQLAADGRALSDIVLGQFMPTNNYYETIAEGVAATPIGQTFSSAESGTLTIYARTAVDPYYLVIAVVGGGGSVSIPIIFVTDEQFGAVGDGVADDTAAIQAAINYLKNLSVSYNGGTIVFPIGRYKTTAPIVMASRITLSGPSGHVGALIEGAHAGNLFQAASASYVTFSGMAFTGTGCTAIKQTGSPTVGYLENFTFDGCHFHGDLANGVEGNLIYPRFTGDCTFGYFGNVGTSHRAIASTGISTNQSNMILIEDTRIYNAKGGEAVRIENAIAVMLSGVNFEQNECCPLRTFGALNMYIGDRTWFEMNSGTDCEIEINPGSAIIDTSACEIAHCHFTPHGDVVQFVKVNATVSSLSFKYNTGDATGKLLTNAPTKVVERIGNRMTNGGTINKDYIFQDSATFSFADFSGAALSLTLPVGNYVRNGNEVSATLSFAYPVTANTANAKIGGLPYACTVASVGAVLSDLSPAAYTAPTISNPPTQAEVQAVATALATQSTAPRAIDVATDAGASTLTLFKPGTLTPLTNAQLSGKSLYITVSYIAATPL